MNIYRSRILPYLSYGIIVWGQAAQSNLDKLLILQKRALRLIKFTPYRSHAFPLFTMYNVHPINMLYFTSSLHHTSAKFVRILEYMKPETKSRVFTDLLSNSPKRSPRFSPGYEGTENMFYFLNKYGFGHVNLDGIALSIRSS